ncbi:hypothetical protein ANCCEY_07515 [Ancylostoma ceylanicum]|uniref:UPAR/Ly6 domain-containing protein n=1 Tax=Ancylostoma ceylanicum TaxID=53326 RepID=A0A0D6LMV0_9BILA|nr:hypothetical protein ANCCEY_07515 [Ancylostoma ceylanicum]
MHDWVNKRAVWAKTEPHLQMTTATLKVVAMKWSDAEVLVLEPELWNFFAISAWLSHVQYELVGSVPKITAEKYKRSAICTRIRQTSFFGIRRSGVVSRSLEENHSQSGLVSIFWRIRARSKCTLCRATFVAIATSTSSVNAQHNSSTTARATRRDSLVKKRSTVEQRDIEHPTNQQQIFYDLSVSRIILERSIYKPLFIIDTYTIMKECISEQDHYHTFPNKGYPIDEECDLVEVQGEEIAYCLCRNQNLCNKPTIADQFIAFEEKHPELFGDAESSTAPPAVPTGAAPLPLPMPSAAKVGFGAPLVAPPPIIPINDPRAKLPGIESEIRRAQLPTREHMPDFSVATGDNPISLENGNLFHLKPSAASQGQFIGSIGMNRHAVAVPPAPPAPPTMKPAKSFPELKCAQCGQTGLRSADADCEKQTVVRCQDSDAVCFTRQITIGPGQSAVEKMCVSWQAVQAEFPSAAMDSCGDSSEGQVRYCVCTTDECNSMAISLQITKDFPVEMLPPPVRTAEPEPALPPLPASPVARVPSGAAGSLQPEHTPSIIVPVPSTSSRMEEMDSNAQDRSQDKAVNSVQLAKEPSGRELQSSSAVKPHFLKCSACVESGMTDPTADCSTSAPAMCSAHEEYCLTKQTQNDDGTFTMEKRCVAQTSLVSLTESTDVKKGCATANGGMINYCLCQGDLCNQDSLLAQAQVSGVRKPELPSKPQTPPVQQPPKVDSPKPSVSNMPTVFLDNDEAAGVQTETDNRRRKRADSAAEGMGRSGSDAFIKGLLLCLRFLRDCLRPLVISMTHSTNLQTLAW